MMDQHYQQDHWIKLSSKSTNDEWYIAYGYKSMYVVVFLVSIEANNLEDGSAIDISNDGSSLFNRIIDKTNIKCKRG